MREFKRSTQMSINLLSSLIVFASNMAINFFLSPYIVKNIGVEANGFVQLANNFISYATLLVGVINSMAGRFVTLEVHKGNTQKANVYYTSVFYADLLLLAVFIVPSIIFIWNLEKVIEIPAHLTGDVKLLFTFIFMNFLVGLAVPMWGTSTYITNRLYISSLGTMISSIIRIVTIVLMFALFKPSVWYVGFAAFLVILFTKVWDYWFKDKLIPELKVKRKSFDIKAVTELVASGIWNAISSLGNILLSGFDLIICNLFIGTVEMGVLSLSKTIPHILTSLSSTICNVFAPELTINYAMGNKERLKKDLKQAMNITGILLTIPLAVLFVFGESFFGLWVPSQDAQRLQVLSSLAVISLIFTSGTQVLYNVFVTVNKVKTNSILMVMSGAVSTLAVLVCLKNTNLGIYAVAGASSVVNIIRNMCYTVPFTAKYLGFKWHTFFPQVGKSVLSVCLLVLMGFLTKHFIPTVTWMGLVIACAITAVAGFAVNVIIVLSKEERGIIFNLIKSKIKRKER